MSFLDTDVIEILNSVVENCKVWKKDLSQFLETIENEGIRKLLDTGDYLDRICEKKPKILIDAMEVFLGPDTLEHEDRSLTHTHENQTSCLLTNLYAVYVFKTLHIETEGSGLYNMYCLLRTKFHEIYCIVLRNENVDPGYEGSTCAKKYSFNLFMYFELCENVLNALSATSSYWSCMHHKSHAIEEGLYLSACKDEETCMVCKKNNGKKTTLAFSQFKKGRILGADLHDNFKVVTQMLIKKLCVSLPSFRPTTLPLRLLQMILQKMETDDYGMYMNLVRSCAHIRLRDYPREQYMNTSKVENFAFSGICKLDLSKSVKLNAIQSFIDEKMKCRASMMTECENLLRKDRTFQKHLENEILTNTNSKEENNENDLEDLNIVYKEMEQLEKDIKRVNSRQDIERQRQLNSLQTKLHKTRQQILKKREIQLRNSEVNNSESETESESSSQVEMTPNTFEFTIY